MPANTQSFIELCIDNNILRFGEFKLKSGRVSPYFFNAGLFNNGVLLGALSGHYAELISRRQNASFMLYGPAYKGIPLAAATSLQLAAQYDMQIDYAFNRKEAKDHGEGGNIVGADLRGEVVIIDDVITAGTSIGESVEIITAASATPSAVVIALDRQETAGSQEFSAVQLVEKEYGISVDSIIRLDDLIAHLSQSPSMSQYADAVIRYQQRYGCA